METSKITIPMFPLKIVVLPGEEIKLHIFEDRYKQLLSDCESHESTFGIPVMMEDTMLNIGTEVKLERVIKRYEDGKADIVIKGMNLFSIIGFYQELPEKQYGGGQARLIDLEKYSTSNKLQDLFTNYLNKFNTEEAFPKDIQSMSIFDIGNYLFLSPIQKLKLINNKTIDSREEILIKQMHFLEIIMIQERNIKNNFYPN